MQKKRGMDILRERTGERDERGRENRIKKGKKEGRAKKEPKF